MQRMKVSSGMSRSPTKMAKEVEPEDSKVSLKMKTGKASTGKIWKKRDKDKVRNSILIPLLRATASRTTIMKNSIMSTRLLCVALSLAVGLSVKIAFGYCFESFYRIILFFFSYFF